MPEVVTFVNYRPPARYDSLPWTTARIQEAATETGTYTQIDSAVLSPVDADPANPVYRSFTTELGTAAAYWYRIVFADGTGDTSQPTTPLQNLPGSTVTPHAYGDVSELQRLLRLNAPTPAQTDAMQRCLEAAAAEIDWELGYSAASPPPDPPSPLVVEVNYERAVEHWQQGQSPFGIIGLGADTIPIVAARDSWYRHARKLAPLKTEWGIA